VKVRYESSDGKVTGYGDEGRIAVEEYEGAPWMAWEFPWSVGKDGGVYAVDGRYARFAQVDLAALAFSKMVPVIQEAVKDAEENWEPHWRAKLDDSPRYGWIRTREVILNEALDAGRQ
jgi:hypothetical protein